MISNIGFIANIGVPGLIVILVLALVIFGPKRLPEMGRAVGETLQEFKKSTKELVNEEVENVKEISKQVEEEEKKS